MEKERLVDLKELKDLKKKLFWRTIEKVKGRKTSLKPKRIAKIAKTALNYGKAYEKD